jgi:hypothetical protein
MDGLMINFSDYVNFYALEMRNFDYKRKFHGEVIFILREYLSIGSCSTESSD